MCTNRHGNGYFHQRCRRALLGLLLATVASGTQAVAEDLEAKVKAAYLYNLTKFVEWPVLPANEMRICVLGSDAVGGMMGELANRKVHDLPLRVEVDVVADPTQCQVLFIGRNEKRIPEILKRVRGSGVLTVSDMDEFARHGGMVGFYVESGKVKLEINPDNVHVANLRVSAKLLDLARMVP